MNLLTNLWDTWSNYEKLREVSFLVLIFLVISITLYFITKERKITLLSMIAMIIAAILNVVGLILSDILFKVQITEIFRLIPIITAILLLSNLSLLAGFFLAKRNKKNFSFDVIREEYRSDSVKQTIFLVVLSLSVFLFVSIQTQVILGISVLSTLITVWSTYWISKYLLK